MAVNVTKPLPRKELVSELKQSVAGILPREFNTPPRLERLADFVNEFHLESAVKNGNWSWGTMEFLPAALQKEGLLCVTETDIATIQIGISPEKGEKETFTIRVAPKDDSSEIAEISMGCTVASDGNKETGTFSVQDRKEPNRALVIINFFHMYLGSFNRRMSVTTWPPISAELSTWVQQAKAGETWDLCRDFVCENAGLV